MKWKAEPDVDIQVIVFGAGPFDEPFAPPVIDVTQYVRGGGISIKRGRSDEFSTFQSGSCTFTLKNDNREFDPSSPEQIILDGGSSVVPADSIDAGASTTPSDSFDAEAEDDSSPFAAILKPLRRVQVLATYQGALRSLFVGYIDGWPRSWTHTTGSVEIVAHDALSVMARTQTSPSLGVLVLDHPDDGKLDRGRLAGDLPEQWSGERVLSLLQLAGFSFGVGLITDTGLTRVVAQEPTGNVLQLAQQAELAEAGFLFVDRDGIIRFLDRHSRFQDTRIGTVQQVFTDNQYSNLAVDRDLTQVRNDIVFSRPDGPEQRCTDDESIHDYGHITFRQEIPVVSDGETFARADFYCDRYGQPQDRPAPILVRPRRNMPQLFAACAGRELLDRIQVERTPLGVGPTTTFTGLAESIEHRITNESWETMLGISPIDVSEGATFLIIGDATLGNLDQETLAY